MVSGGFYWGLASQTEVIRTLKYKSRRNICGVSPHTIPQTKTPADVAADVFCLFVCVFVCFIVARIGFFLL